MGILEFRPVFPVPPFQKLRLMAFARCIIYSATKNIKKTRIDASSNLCAATGIELLRVFSLQILDLANPQFPEIFRNAFAYTWDCLKFSECPRLGE